jgi:PleD family two-component response regulator
VRRLEGVRRDLGRILENESWDGRVRTARNDELSELSVYINEMLDIIREKIALVKEQSLTDPLTSLSNRRHFDLQMDTALVQFRRDQSAGALVLFDIDYFKRYNDTYGHPQGDDVLVKFAQCMRQSAKRPMDVLARVGGEEFAILMPMTDSDGASHCAEQVRAAMQGPEDTAETLYSRADRALYAAKNSGRNKVVLG